MNMEEFPVNVLGCSRNFSSEMIEVMARAARVFFSQPSSEPLIPRGPRTKNCSILNDFIFGSVSWICSCIFYQSSQGLFCSNNPKGQSLALLRIDVMYVGSWVRPPRTATRMTLHCTCHNCILGGGYVAYMSWAFPAATSSNGHHQDHYDSSKGAL